MSDQEPQTEERTSNFRVEPLYKIAQFVVDGELGEFVYCLQDDNFYEYKDGYWQIIAELKLLKTIENGIIREVTLKYPDGTVYKKKVKVLQRYAPSRKEQVMKHLKLITLKELPEFNTYSLINFENYMYDSEGNNILKHEPKYLSTIRIPYRYDAFAKCDLWIKTLLEIFEGDKNKMKALQEYFGYCLSSDNEQKKGLLLLGETDTGKSTIIDIFRELIGEHNCSNVPLQYLSNPQYTPLLINKMVNIDPEVNKEAVNYEREFKIITGGKRERVSCNQKHIPTFEFVPRCKLILSANIFPRITDHSSAFYQRLLLIPCDRRFSEDEKDRQLHDKLRVELPGIFNWVMEGQRNLKKRGRFEQYDFMREAVQDLEDENNPAHLFFQEHVTTDVSEGTYVEKSDLFNKYRSWCVENGQRVLTHIMFSRCVIKKYVKLVDKDSRLSGNGARIWRNIKYVPFKSGEVKQEVNWQEPAETTVNAVHIGQSAEGAVESKQDVLYDPQNINWET